MEITVNEKVIEIKESDLEKSLIKFLREDLDLTGSKIGCEVGICGGCTVLINDITVKSCTRKLKSVIGKKIVTIEGLEGKDGILHPVQQAFIDAGAIQCGFCTPGMVLAAHAFLLRNNKPAREEIKRALAANLCRCTGYKQIIDAVEIAAKFYGEKT